VGSAFPIFQVFYYRYRLIFLDLLTLIFLKEFLGVKPVIAVMINQILVIFYVFFMNKYWSFRKNDGSTQYQMMRFFIVVFYNYCFSILTMYVFGNRLSFDYRLIRTGSIIAAVSWNFFLYKYWVYAPETRAANIETNGKNL
jgi:putative flippase GtrA